MFRIILGTISFLYVFFCFYAFLYTGTMSVVQGLSGIISPHQVGIGVVLLVCFPLNLATAFYILYLAISGNK
ncbi:MAG: hypothetical protein KAU20_05825 [Nanoarchaeota archaeon]|nr:hypothetical protein [Nanoarchaeota archaeon]